MAKQLAFSEEARRHLLAEGIRKDGFTYYPFYALIPYSNRV